jgi:protein-tyrosine-phosphatase
MHPERETLIADSGIADLGSVMRPLPDSAAGQFRIAFVCSANQFRSVLAEAVCAYLVGGSDVEVCSFGVLDLPPTPPHDRAVQLARALRLDVASHRSRRLEPGVLANMNAVVGFDRAHVAAAVVDGGAEVERTFLLTELLQLLVAAGAGTTATELAPDEMVQRLVAARRLGGHAEASPIPDPGSAPADVQRAIALKVVELVTHATVAIMPPADDTRATALLRRIEKLQGKQETHTPGRWRRWRSGRRA